MNDSTEQLTAELADTGAAYATASFVVGMIVGAAVTALAFVLASGGVS